LFFADLLPHSPIEEHSRRPLTPSIQQLSTKKKKTNKKSTPPFVLRPSKVSLAEVLVHNIA
jgi:hypothetical protein